MPPDDPTEVPLRYTVRIAFESQEDAILWFHDLRGAHLMPENAGLCHLELIDIQPPGREVPLVIADAERPRAWVVEPG